MAIIILCGGRDHLSALRLSHREGGGVAFLYPGMVKKKREKKNTRLKEPVLVGKTAMQIETMQSESQQHEIPPTPTHQGLLFVLSAPSGAGKDTVIQALQTQGTDFFVVPSVTTRAPRPGESEGKPYYFVDSARF